jgi:hypothetical protein
MDDTGDTVSQASAVRSEPMSLWRGGCVAWGWDGLGCGEADVPRKAGKAAGCRYGEVDVRLAGSGKQATQNLPKMDDHRARCAVRFSDRAFL